MANTVLELKDVWKVYKMGEVEVPALKGINLKVEDGEFVAVIGSSGSGKSTALNMMGALDSPSRGRILLDGVDITTLSESGLARVRGKKIGFIFQVFNLYPTLNVYENIALPMRIHEFPEAEIRKNTTELIRRVGLGSRARHLPKELSGGERQRVAIARALSTSPSMVLADEPTGNLDSKTSHEIMKILAALNRTEGRTVVLITHEPEMAEYTDRIITLKDGEIISDEHKGRKQK